MKRMLTQLACQRPHYYAQALESLAQCKGIENWELHISVEPVCEAVIEMARRFSACPTTVHVNPARYGHTRNFHEGFKRCFAAGADYAALTEEDTLVAVDFLQWHEFASEKFKDDPTVFTVAGGHYCHKGYYRPEHIPLYNAHNLFMNKGWATWRDRWFESGGMAESWEQYELIHPDGRIETRYTERGYEGYILNRHVKDRVQIYPVVTRVNDIGRAGVHCNDLVYDTLIKINDWAGNYDLSDVSYKDERPSTFVNYVPT